MSADSTAREIAERLERIAGELAQAVTPHATISHTNCEHPYDPCTCDQPERMKENERRILAALADAEARVRQAEQERDKRGELLVGISMALTDNSLGLSGPTIEVVRGLVLRCEIAEAEVSALSARLAAVEREREEAFKAGYHCQWIGAEMRYIFDPAMKPGDPDGAYAAWLTDRDRPVAHRMAASCGSSAEVQGSAAEDDPA
jgi:hypothetical protein